MRRLLAALVLLAAPALADPAAEAQAVIARQIEAFRADDWDGAFAFASPGIQSMFRTPEAFGRMVRGGYPMVWRPARVAPESWEGSETSGVQRMRITDAAGDQWIAAYRMARIDGAWRIEGVTIERAPGLSA